MSSWNQITSGFTALFITLNAFSFFAYPSPQVGRLAAKIAAELNQESPNEVASIQQTETVNDAASRVSEQDRESLILNAFNEARGESVLGIKAILGVTMARVDSACYPDSITDVVYQPHQFSWTKQRGTARTLASAARKDPQALQQIKSIVDEYIAEGAKPSNALLYHANYVRPKWSKSPNVTRVKRVGSHLFYDLKNC